MKKLNCMCFDCKLLKNDCEGTTWNLNDKIKAKFSRLNHITDNYIYVGLLVTATGWNRQDYIDIMSFFDCVGFEKITEEEAKKVSVLPTGNYCEFLKLQKAI